MFSIGLSLIQLLVVTAFLANLSEADEFKWMFTFAVVLLQLSCIRGSGGHGTCVRRHECKAATVAVTIAVVFIFSVGVP